MHTEKRKGKFTLPIDTSKCGVRIMPETIYKYPEDHPCFGCFFIFESSKPSCMTGSYPDYKNCIYAFYKRISKIKTKSKNVSNPKKP